MLIEVHMLKNYAPSNLNRDETGSPKDCIFGGIPRGRISSQCQKRNLRLSSFLQDSIDSEHWGLRTRKLAELVTEELRKEKVAEEYLPIIKKKLTGFGNKDGKESKDELTAQIMFFSPADIKAVTEKILELIAEKKTLNEFEKIKAKDLQSSLKDAGRPITVDIALFGRMVTSEAFRDVEASMQMAHAISTNRLEREFDYYTAMDDLLQKGEETGASMIDDVEFNSNCYYHYFNLDVDQLVDNLKGVPDIPDLIRKIIPAMVKAFAFVNPSGKQNSFAAHALPSLICVEVKEKKIPVSYVNAFVSPVQANRNRDLVAASVDRLAQEIDKIDRKFQLDIKNRWWFTTQEEIKAPDKCKAIETLNELISDLEQVLKGAV